MAIKVEVVEQGCVPGHDRALPCGMGHVCSNHFEERAGQSAGHAAIGCVRHQGFKRRTEMFARAGSPPELGGILACPREEDNTKIYESEKKAQRKTVSLRIYFALQSTLHNYNLMYIAAWKHLQTPD